jgi:hypothetical protein
LHKWSNNDNFCKFIESKIQMAVYFPAKECDQVTGWGSCPLLSTMRRLSVLFTAWIMEGIWLDEELVLKTSMSVENWLVSSSLTPSSKAVQIKYGFTIHEHVKIMNRRIGREANWLSVGL